MHYGLEFAFYSSPQEVNVAVEKLAKKNRVARLTDAEKKRLRFQIRERQKIRARKETARRKECPK